MCILSCPVAVHFLRCGGIFPNSLLLCFRALLTCKIVYKKSQINNFKINKCLVYKKLEKIRRKKQNNSRSTATTLDITHFFIFCCSAVEESINSHIFFVVDVGSKCKKYLRGCDFSKANQQSASNLTLSRRSAFYCKSTKQSNRPKLPDYLYISGAFP